MPHIHPAPSHRRITGTDLTPLRLSNPKRLQHRISRVADDTGVLGRGRKF
ncbi:hypothetical protein N8146_00825 [Ascidiaceihabitans sp.]|nr:hypothetical protein [Ascidiaceihabitans sp.]